MSGGKDEIGELGNNFNVMSEQLEQALISSEILLFGCQFMDVRFLLLRDYCLVRM